MKRLFFPLEFDVMKRILLAITILTLVAGAGGLCYATPFTDLEDFSGTGTDDSRTYFELSGSGSPYEFTYSHSIDFTPAAQSIASPTLTLSHKGNSANSGEGWFITDTSDVFLGTLANSTNANAWVDQDFDLSSLVSGISGSTWTITLKLYENTSGTDKLWIDKSVVTGEYEPVPINPVTEPATVPLPGTGLVGYEPVSTDPVPEPATVLLLGTGLVGFAGFRRKFRK